MKMAPLSGVVYAICKHVQQTGRRAVLVVAAKGEAEEALFSARTFIGPECVQLLTHYELNPYEPSSPDPRIVAGRIETLYRILDKTCRIVVSTAEAFSAFTAPPDALRGLRLGIKTGMTLEMEGLIRWLAAAGYQRIPEVSDPGDFAVRGGIVDVFTPAAGLPVRLEFFANTIESIRIFDPHSQRTVEKSEGALLYPASEIFWKEEGFSPREGPLLPHVSDFFKSGARFPGIEFFIPRLYGKKGTLLDYFDDGPHIIFYDFEKIKKQQNFLSDLARNIYDKSDRELPSPEELFATGDDMLAVTEGYPLTLIDSVFERQAERELFGLDILSVSGKSFPLPSPLRLSGLLKLLRRAREKRMACRVVVPSPYRLEVMGKILREHEFFPKETGEEYTWADIEQPAMILSISGIKRGFSSEKEGLLLVTDQDIFGKKAKYRSQHPPDREKERVRLQSFKENDLVVHEDYGIGIYRGLKAMKVGDYPTDFAIISYDGGDILYLPIYRLDLIQKYVGGEKNNVKLDRLGSKRWEQTKRRVRERVHKVAGELLSLYAEREISHGFSFDLPDAAFEEFASGFDFEETEDQERAIEEVIGNMTSDRPMDRLVCGDVGYGKTEVALRAAFIGVMSGKQVALLCPTTVLAEQHGKTFRERFDPFPVRVAVLSRFLKAGDQRKVLEDLEKGRLDIVIGTHRLLQSDVVFRDLGLLIIDEEQKFGVMHKEKLKKMRTGVDVLTLSATPIPRTFNIALSGIKDISLISTPPKERLSIKTFVVSFSEEVIREGIGRELRRGGQVYYVHNRIQTIRRVERYLRDLFKEARIEVAHGQMGEEQLSRVMKLFYRGEVDILLCTAIVESGLDVPRANTMIVDRAHTFGLAQLYQLRGRIGRDKRRAYAYLIVPPETALSTEAVARLSAIEELSELGSGYQVASYDLDIRGGGDIIGPNQSGHIQHVGYEMYLRFLEEAVSELKGKPVGRRVLSDIELNVPAYIPNAYVENPHVKLDLYRKIALIRSGEDYEEAISEFTDRFGAAPEAVKNLLCIARLRSELSRLGVKELKRSRGRIHLTFDVDADVDRNLLARLILEEKGRYGLDRKGVFYARTEFSGSNWDRLICDLNAVFGENKIELPLPSGF